MRLIDADKLRHELIMGRDLIGAKYTDMADTVEAIPIEWIKSWAMKNWAKSEKCEFDIIVSKLIDDWWEEENGKQ